MSIVFDRFEALGKLVVVVHEKCKEKHTIETLIDSFSQLMGLQQAFLTDCFNFLPGREDEALADLVYGIQGLLQCSGIHLQESAAQLNTNILETIVEKMSGAQVPPSAMN